METKIDEKKEITFENVDISISVNAQGKSEFDNVTKKNTKRRKVMTTAVAAISSVALLATATYAWFVLTNRPTISEMSMQAGTSGNLQISLSEDSGYGTNIEFPFELEEDETAILKPLASINGYTFHEPIYDNSGHVKSVKEEELSGDNIYNNTEANEGKLIKQEFYLKANGTSSNVDDKIGIGLVGKYESATSYTKVTDEDGTGAKAVRISFVYDDDNDEETAPVVTVYEPNADYSTVTGTGNNRTTIADQVNPYTDEEGGIGEIVYRYIRQDGDGKFQAGYASNTITAASTYSEVYSPELFRIPTNTACKITMYVWLEGTDSNCTNAVEGDSFNAQFMFYSSDLQ